MKQTLPVSKVKNILHVRDQYTRQNLDQITNLVDCKLVQNTK